MLAKLSGKVTDILGNAIVVDIGGVGYLVHVPLPLKLELVAGTPISLFTHLAVREQSLDLYGFKTATELSFFEMLISVSGVGPKTALGILSLAPVETLAGAIRAGDTSYLTKVSGIGKKSAERIVVELRDKLSAALGESGDTGGADIEVLEALQALGYSAAESRQALRGVATEGMDVRERLSIALKNLGSPSQNVS